MSLPAIRGVIDRRILLNYRVDPDALAGALPAPFEPLTVDGYGVGGICLIRLRDVAPQGLPTPWGFGSENAAHRIAVEHGSTDSGSGAHGNAVESESDAGRETGVYVPRRDTSSRLFAAAGGRLFSNRHHRARFDVAESADRYDVAMESVDGSTRVRVAGNVADGLPSDSVFDTLAEASAFFENGSTGWSDDGADGDYHALELRTDEWAVDPLAVDAAESSYFEDATRFPPDAVELDCALLMRDVAHEWHEKEPLCTTA